MHARSIPSGLLSAVLGLLSACSTVGPAPPQRAPAQPIELGPAGGIEGIGFGVPVSAAEEALRLRWD
jgi:hypothetical protein